MDNSVLFDNTLRLAEKSLDLRSRRHDLIVSDLANADTPGYKAFDLMVEESLREQYSDTSNLHLQTTQSGHIPSAGIGRSSVNPEITPLPEVDNLRGDGNTVDMDREMANLASNQLLYKVSTQIVSKKFQQLKSVITGGR